jgi:hypothetical protein
VQVGGATYTGYPATAQYPDGYCAVTGFYGSYTNIAILGYVNKDVSSGYMPCIQVGGFNSNTTVSVIDIPNTVTHIKSGAFMYCSNLTAVNGMSGVQTIEDYAFYDCSHLQNNFVIPASVTNIGQYVFSGTNITKFWMGSYSPPTCSANSFPPGAKFVLRYDTFFNGSIWSDYVNAWSWASGNNLIKSITPTNSAYDFYGQTQDRNDYFLGESFTIYVGGSAYGGVNVVGGSITCVNAITGTPYGVVNGNYITITNFSEPIIINASVEFRISYAQGTAPTAGSLSGSIGDGWKAYNQQFTISQSVFTDTANKWQQVGWSTDANINNRMLPDRNFTPNPNGSSPRTWGAGLGFDGVTWTNTQKQILYSTNQPMTLYPIWAPLTNTLTFNPGNTPADTSLSYLSVTQKQKQFNQNFDLGTVSFVITGYTQVGWTVNNVAGGAVVGRTVYTAAPNIYTANQDASFYPIWQPVEYIITYHSGTSQPSQTQIKYHGEPAKTQGALYTLHGLEQLRWINFWGDPISFNVLFSVNMDLDLYPVWSKNLGTVILHNVSHLGITSVWTFDTSNASTLVLPSSMPSNFAGWYLNDVKITAIPPSTPAGSVLHIYAKWT